MMKATLLRLPARVKPCSGCQASLTVCGLPGDTALPWSGAPSLHAPPSRRYRAELRSCGGARRIGEAVAAAMAAALGGRARWAAKAEALRCGAYHNAGLALHGSLSVVHECHGGCACNGECGNRVVQTGIRPDVRTLACIHDREDRYPVAPMHRPSKSVPHAWAGGRGGGGGGGVQGLREVLRVGPETGWGLRSWTSIPAGRFVCEYAGEVLTDRQADMRCARPRWGA
jgi:hypothetical protein